MKINTITTKNTNNYFARNQKIREADSIQRLTKKEFPMISSSYMQAFSPLLREGRDDKNAVNAHFKLLKIKSKIATMRDMCNYPADYGIHLNKKEKKIPFYTYIKNIKENKYGNCNEASITVLAALTANGYYDSKKIGLSIGTTFINKKTNEIEYQTKTPSDHSAVVTTMRKDSHNLKNNEISSLNTKDIIVIDSWLGFADNISGAKAKYKETLIKSQFDDCIQSNIYRFKKYMQDKKNIIVDLNDYIIKTSIIFDKHDKFSQEEKKKLGEYTAKSYPNLIL